MKREEAITYVKDLCNKLWSKEEQEALETLIPELKESDDERIKKSIILLLQRGGCMSPEDKDKAYAWLEKQKEDYSSFSEEQRKYMEKYISLDKVTLVKLLAERDKNTGEILSSFGNKEEQKEKSTEDTAIQKAFISSKIDYTLEEKWDASDYADIILPTNVSCGESEEEYKLHKIIEAAFIAGQKKEQKPIFFIPKFRVGDKIVSTNDSRLSYNILEVGHTNELGNPEYKVEIFQDGKPAVMEKHNIHYIECHKMDEWGKLIEQRSEVKYVYPMFKVGDTIKPKAYNESHRVNEIKDDKYVLDNGFIFPIVGQDVWEIVKQKTTECIEFDNEFKNQVSHLLASVLNKEWKYNKGFVEYAAQQLLEYEQMLPLNIVLKS